MERVMVGDTSALFFLCARALRKLMEEPSPTLTSERWKARAPSYLPTVKSAHQRYASPSARLGA